MYARNEPGSQQTADTHSSHERAEQNPQGNRRRSDHKLQNLEPNNFVDQRGTAATDKQKNEKRQVPLLLRDRTRLICNHFTHTMHTPTQTLI